tara:strand:- start:44 stop:619 length:576 start_codon:yes stop_codon:yes gene_type:complete
MAPKRKAAATGSKSAGKKVCKADDPPLDQSLVLVLKAFVGTLFQSHEGAIVSDAEGTITMALMESLKRFLSKFVEDDERSALLAAYSKGAMEAKLKWGLFELGDGMCRDQCVGGAFLPLLKFVKTEALAQRWLAEHIASGFDAEDPNDDRQCDTIKDYLPHKVNSLDDYLKRVAREESGGTFYTKKEMEDM